MLEKSGRNEKGVRTGFTNKQRIAVAKGVSSCVNKLGENVPG